jgi:hypothetical protein
MMHCDTPSMLCRACWSVEGLSHSVHGMYYAECLLLGNSQHLLGEPTAVVGESLSLEQLPVPWQHVWCWAQALCHW